MKLYLDTCVWCRPFDEATEKILKETDALMRILRKFDAGELEIFSSSVLLAEISFISSEEKREAVEGLVRKVSKVLIISESAIELAEEIMKVCGIDAMDSLHIAIAVENADVFITVDNEILKKSNCLEKYIDVKNPIDVV